MNAKELIEQLKLVPQDLPILLVGEDNVDDNFWLKKVEVSHTGSSGYETEGEIRLVA